MSEFSRYEFRTQPWFDQEHFDGFNRQIPMKTVVIHCFDPRATHIPEAVAAYLGDEVYPGEVVFDESGQFKAGSTRTLFPLTNGGGRAAEALASVAIMDYLFAVKNVVVVHHSFCGATAFTPELLFRAFEERHHTDLSLLFAGEDVSILDFERSIRHDVALLRSSPAVPKSVNLYGLFFDINSGELTEIVRDVPA